MATANEKTGNKKSIVIAALSLSVLMAVGVQLAVGAQARDEEFHSSSQVKPAKKKPLTPEENPVVQAGALAMGSTDSPAVRWFEQVDKLIALNMKTPTERTTLSQGFNQEVERVKKWSDTAGHVERRYRVLSQNLRALPIPANHPGLKDYVNLTADWYQDAAEIYEQLLKPRQPAQTMEELDEQLKRVQDRAQALKVTQKNLRQMDMSLRKTYRVHMPRYDDALQQYVRGTDD